jgi:hypothetical protein
MATRSPVRRETQVRLPTHELVFLQAGRILYLSQATVGILAAPVRSTLFLKDPCTLVEPLHLFIGMTQLSRCLCIPTAQLLCKRSCVTRLVV